jgi:hypothetical protein
VRNFGLVVRDTPGSSQLGIVSLPANRATPPAGTTLVAGRCAASAGGLRRALQQRSPEQRGWLHHSEEHGRRASAGDPSRLYDKPT